MRVLVFRIGSLGDTLVALPAMWAIRRFFEDAELTLLCDTHPGRSLVFAADLLRATGMFKNVESYPVANSALGLLSWPMQMLMLLLKLRNAGFDSLVYLAPSYRTRQQATRDRLFFAAAGIKRFIGIDWFQEFPPKTPDKPLPAIGHEADLLLARLASSGIPVPPAGRGCCDLKLGAGEAAQVESWLGKLPADGKRTWVGIGPGAKQPVNRWPVENYGAVVQDLIDRFDIWPVVFGGAEDAGLADTLLRRWRRGYNAAGLLEPRATAYALQRCRLFLGNDTGTMHLAACAAIPCVGVYSSREWPGMWYPYGVERRIFRTVVECEGCRLRDCVARNAECIKRIQPSDVAAACADILQNRTQEIDHRVSSGV